MQTVELELWRQACTSWSYFCKLPLLRVEVPDRVEPVRYCQPTGNRKMLKWSSFTKCAIWAAPSEPPSPLTGGTAFFVSCEPSVRQPKSKPAILTPAERTLVAVKTFEREKANHISHHQPLLMLLLAGHFSVAQMFPLLERHKKVQNYALQFDVWCLSRWPEYVGSSFARTSSWKCLLYMIINNTWRINDLVLV